LRPNLGPLGLKFWLKRPQLLMASTPSVKWPLGSKSVLTTSRITQPILKLLNLVLDPIVNPVLSHLGFQDTPLDFKGLTEERMLTKYRN
jgi:hypothetical protein